MIVDTLRCQLGPAASDCRSEFEPSLYFVLSRVLRGMAGALSSQVTE